MLNLQDMIACLSKDGNALRNLPDVDLVPQLNRLMKIARPPSTAIAECYAKL